MSSLENENIYSHCLRYVLKEGEKLRMQKKTYEGKFSNVKIFVEITRETDICSHHRGEGGVFTLLRKSKNPSKFCDTWGDP